jgi:hypothetical protein
VYEIRLLSLSLPRILVEKKNKMTNYYNSGGQTTTSLPTTTTTTTTDDTVAFARILESCLQDDVSFKL